MMSALDFCTFKKQLSGRDDYCFDGYSELCSFVYCLLSWTRKLTSLPELNDWQKYMDCDELSGFEKVDTEDFLLNWEFGEALQQDVTSATRDFRNRSRELLESLVDVILSLNLVSSEVMQGLLSFCPEILLEGDDQHIFRLFGELLTVLKRSGCVSEDEIKPVLRSLQLMWSTHERDMLLAVEVVKRDP